MKKSTGLKTFILSLVTICLTSIVAYAAHITPAVANNMSWSWEYYDTSGNGDESYNCLGYATGSYTWEWPWPIVQTNVYSSDVNQYLNTKYGYSNVDFSNKNVVSNSKWKIVSYGPGYNQIAHFSKVTPLNPDYCIAKWGRGERFYHYSLDPYYSSSSYGDARVIYYK